MIEMRAHGRNERAPVAAGDEANLQMRGGARRNRVDRTVGIAGAKREHFERVPAEDALGRRQSRLAPVGVDRGAVRLAGLDVGERAPHRRAECGGGASPATRIRPRASTIDAIALASTMPGLASRPPQFPEWCAPSRRSTTRSKLNAPREPRKIVGRSERKTRAVGGDQHVGSATPAHASRRSAADRASPPPRPSRSAASR